MEMLLWFGRRKPDKRRKRSKTGACRYESKIIHKQWSFSRQKLSCTVFVMNALETVINALSAGLELVISDHKHLSSPVVVFMLKRKQRGRASERRV